MGRRRSSAVKKLFAWVRRQSIKVKSFLGVTSVISALVTLKLLVKDDDNFFIASEAVHFLGIIVLIYKLTIQKTCSGLSLKSQELTAMFLAVRLCCNFIMEGDIHTVLDFATLVSTLWVIYTIRFKLKSTYIEELDNMPIYYLVVPCAILAVIVHPCTYQARISRIFWAFCVYLESIAVLPQLRMMQSAKTIEPFTAHYVFALGVARFLNCAHWLIQVYDTAGMYLFMGGSGGYLWLPMVIVSEIVQTLILADFCFYYIKSVIMNGGLLLSRPLPV
ncbi:hypothetical protein ACH5RR_010404 [Cinchona calisaya]|uniref:ER lumen protein retaining receptor n=1 Tax=Cinchona calisaya TaxID=153742 RepID=A0ABD3AIU0_9GENT